MHKIRNNHTAPLYLPHAGKLEGIMLDPGATVIDERLSKLLAELASGPRNQGPQLTVNRWFEAGLLELVNEPDAPEAPAAEPPPAPVAEVEPAPVAEPVSVAVAELPPLNHSEE